MENFDFAPLLGFLGTLIYGLYKYVTPIVNSKLKSDKAKRLTADLGTALEVAKNVVTDLSNHQALTYSDRKKKAVKDVQTALQNRNINFQDETIENVVERAYQFLKNNKLIDNHKPTETKSVEELSDKEIKEITDKKQTDTETVDEGIEE